MSRYRVSSRRRLSDYMDEIHKVEYNRNSDKERHSYDRARRLLGMSDIHESKYVGSDRSYLMYCKRLVDKVQRMLYDTDNGGNIMICDLGKLVHINNAITTANEYRKENHIFKDLSDRIMKLPYLKPLTLDDINELEKKPSYLYVVKMSCGYSKCPNDKRKVTVRPSHPIVKLIKDRIRGNITDKQVSKFISNTSPTYNNKFVAVLMNGVYNKDPSKCNSIMTRTLLDNEGAYTCSSDRCPCDTRKSWEQYL